MRDVIEKALLEAEQYLQKIRKDPQFYTQLISAAEMLIQILQTGGRVFACGNGGSMSDAMHFAEELTGRFRLDRKPLPAIAISDPAHLSCVSNDFGYEQVFSRYIEAHGRENDGLLAISTSGKSQNILRACEISHQRRIKVIGLTGCTLCPLADCVDVLIVTSGGEFSDRVQEMHIKVIHILIELIEKGMFL